LIDNEDIRALGRLSAKIEQNALYKLLRGPDVLNMLSTMENIDLKNFRINQKQCTNNRYREQVCTDCIDSCPVDAVSFEQGSGIRIDEEKCNDCGLCSTVCYNGVIEQKSPSDEKLLSDISDMLKGSAEKNLAFHCTKCDGKAGKARPILTEINPISVPSFGRINEILILKAHLAGAEEVAYSGCDNDCNVTGCRETFEGTRTISEHLAESFGLEHVDKEDLHGAEDGDNVLSDNEYDRRRFVTELGKNAFKLWDKSGSDKAEDENHWDQQIPLRRKLMVKYAGSTDLEKHVIKREGLPFAEVSIDPERCDLCSACSVLCPTGALVNLDLDDSFSLIYFNFGSCTGCELCVKVCPNNAVSTGTTVDLGKLNKNAEVLVKHELENCTNCGSYFVKLKSADACPNCSKNESLKQDIIKQMEGKI
jgi:ferredoxin